MTRSLLVAAAGALAASVLVLAACQQSDAPWLTMPTPEEHATRYFPASPGTTHQECRCADCHGAPGEKSSFREFECLNCHTGAHTNEAEVTALHASVPGFAFTSAACYGCHPQGVGVNHAPIFPIGAGSAHGGVGCRECHLDVSRREVLGCAECHGPGHPAVAGYAASSTLCVRCHADSQVDRIASHTGFGIAPGARHDGERANCLTCHPAMRADKPFGAEFSVPHCLGCHTEADTDADHQGESGYRWETAACLGCHPGGEGGDG